MDNYNLKKSKNIYLLWQWQLICQRLWLNIEKEKDQRSSTKITKKGYKKGIEIDTENILKKKKRKQKSIQKIRIGNLKISLPEKGIQKPKKYGKENQVDIKVMFEKERQNLKTLMKE